MKKLVAAAVIALSLGACASSTTSSAEPEMTPLAPAPDPRVGELQTQLTELLERIDVLNDRIARLEEGAPAPAAPAVVASSAPAPAPETPATAPAVAQPQQPQQPQRALVGAQIAEDYRQAIMLVGRGRNEDARRAFEGVFQADPNGDLADNALFWIGETYFAAKDYTNAVRYYNRVVSDYSTQNKAPDALFKIALSQERTGDLALARRTLQQVIDRYPYSSPASSAKAEMDRIKY